MILHIKISLTWKPGGYLHTEHDLLQIQYSLWQSFERNLWVEIT